MNKYHAVLEKARLGAAVIYTRSRTLAKAFAPAGVRVLPSFGALALMLLLSVGAHAADPTYTSQIGSALEAINMTDLIADVSAFSGMGFQLLLVTIGVFFAAGILHRFLKAR